jgi:hypothetical protein
MHAFSPSWRYMEAAPSNVAVVLLEHQELKDVSINKIKN